MIAYFDSSAVVLLYVAERSSSAARAVRVAAERVFVSYLAFAETHAVLARLRRRGVLSATESDRARARFESDWRTFERMRVDARLLPEVRRAVRVHALTGGDAVHLATAASVRRAAERASRQLLFACTDRRLAAAAVSDGMALAL